MKLTFLKLKRDSLPPLKSLRPRIFDINLSWFAILGLCLIILIITGFIGFNLFYSQYFESYKTSIPAENFSNIINVDRLNSAIEERNSFINKPASLARDPSL